MNLLMVLLSSLFFIVILLRKDTHIHRNEKEAEKNVANKINEIVEKQKKNKNLKRNCSQRHKVDRRTDRQTQHLFMRNKFAIRLHPPH